MLYVYEREFLREQNWITRQQVPYRNLFRINSVMFSSLMGSFSRRLSAYRGAWWVVFHVDFLLTEEVKSLFRMAVTCSVILEGQACCKAGLAQVGSSDLPCQWTSPGLQGNGCMLTFFRTLRVAIALLLAGGWRLSISALWWALGGIGTPRHPLVQPETCKAREQTHKFGLSQLKLETRNWPRRRRPVDWCNDKLCLRTSNVAPRP